MSATPPAPLLREIEPDNVRAFLVAHRDKTSDSTANLARKTLTAFFGWCVDQGFLRNNPVAAVKSFKLDSGPGRVAYSLEQLRLVYSKAPDDFWQYMILAGFYTGQRMGDLVNLKWASVDLGEGILRLTTKKTGRHMQIPIAKPLRAILEARRATASDIRPVDPIWPEQVALWAKFGSSKFSARFAEILITCGLDAVSRLPSIG